MWVLWAIPFLGLLAVVQMMLISEAVKLDRRSPGWFARLSFAARMRILGPNGVFGFVGLTFAMGALAATRDGEPQIAAVAFLVEAVAVLSGAYFSRRALREAFG